MDFSSALGQPSAARRRPSFRKAAHLCDPCSYCPTASLETDSDDANLYRKIGRSAGRVAVGHPPAPGRERKKSVATVVSAPIVLLLLFLAPVSLVTSPPSSSTKLAYAPQRNRENVHHTSNTHKSRSYLSTQSKPESSSQPKKYYSSSDASTRAEQPQKPAPYHGPQGVYKYLYNSIVARKDGSPKVFQGRNLYKGRMVFCTKPFNDGLDPLFKEKESANTVSLSFRTSGVRDQLVSAFREVWNEQMIECVSGVVIEALYWARQPAAQNGKSTQFDAPSTVTMFTSDKLQELTGGKVIFASFMGGPKSDIKLADLDVGTAVLILWDPAKSPFDNRHNMGMVYVIPPYSTFVEGTIRKKGHEIAARNARAIVEHYNHFVNTEEGRRRHLITIDQFQVALMARGVSNPEEEFLISIADENLEGYAVDPITRYTPIIRFSSFKGVFLRAVSKSENEKFHRALSQKLVAGSGFKFPTSNENIRQNPARVMTGSPAQEFYLSRSSLSYGDKQAANRVTLVRCGASFELKGDNKIVTGVHELVERAGMRYHNLRNKMIDGFRKINSLQSDVPHPLEEGDTTFAMAIRSSEIQRITNQDKAGSAVLILWDPAKSPFDNRHNMGMVAVIPPKSGSLSQTQMQKAIKTTVGNTMKLVNAYNIRRYPTWPKIGELDYTMMIDKANIRNKMNIDTTADLFLSTMKEELKSSDDLTMHFEYVNARPQKVRMYKSNFRKR